MAKNIAIIKRDAIMEAANELFNRFTYDKTTMEEIAKAVPISKATLYAEFNNKEDILISICSRDCDVLLTKMDDFLRRSKESRVDALRGSLCAFVSNVYDHASVVQDFDALLYTSRRLSQKTFQLTCMQRKLIERTLRDAIDGGELSKNIDVEAVSGILMDSLAAYLPPYFQPTVLLEESRTPKKLLLKQLDLFLKIFMNGLTKSF